MTRIDALATVRLALRGWAFQHPDGIPARITQAEAELAKLPPAYQQAGNALIEPLRRAARRAEYAYQPKEPRT